MNIHKVNNGMMAVTSNVLVKMQRQESTDVTRGTLCVTVHCGVIVKVFYLLLYSKALRTLSLSPPST